MMRGLSGLNKLSRAASVRKYRAAYGISGRGTEVHHGIAWANGTSGSSWAHHFMNYRPLQQAIHRRIHGRWGGASAFGAARRWWYGTPAWLLGAEGAIGAGTAAEMVDSECGCEN
jgi:hypothetical protein